MPSAFNHGSHDFSRFATQQSGQLLDLLPEIFTGLSRIGQRQLCDGGRKESIYRQRLSIGPPAVNRGFTGLGACCNRLYRHAGIAAFAQDGKRCTQYGDLRRLAAGPSFFRGRQIFFDTDTTPFRLLNRTSLNLPTTSHRRPCRPRYEQGIGFLPLFGPGHSARARKIAPC